MLSMLTDNTNQAKAPHVSYLLREKLLFAGGDGASTE